MSQLGLGAMIHILFGRTQDGAELLEPAKGKRIASAQLHSPSDHPDGVLDVRFEDGTGLRFKDNYRSCCESRYLHTDDDLAYFAGAEFVNAELRDGGSTEDSSKDDYNETMFLLVTTSKGVITVSAHNYHNGYYGGIGLGVEALPVVWP